MASGSHFEDGISAASVNAAVIPVEKVVMRDVDFIGLGLQFLLQSQSLPHVAVQLNVTDDSLRSLAVGVVDGIEDVLTGMVAAYESDMGVGSHYTVDFS